MDYRVQIIITNYTSYQQYFFYFCKHTSSKLSSITSKNELFHTKTKRQKKCHLSHIGALLNSPIVMNRKPKQISNLPTFITDNLNYISSLICPKYVILIFTYLPKKGPVTNQLHKLLFSYLYYLWAPSGPTLIENGPSVTQTKKS